MRRTRNTTTRSRDTLLHDHHTSTALSELVARPITPFEEPAAEAFVLAHPAHGPGHRRAFAALDRATGLRDLTVVAWQGARVVGIAPAVRTVGRVARVLRDPSASGGSLVACGPLVDAALPAGERRAVLAALVRAAAEQARATGAIRLGWIVPAETSDADELVACLPEARRSLVSGFVLDLTRPADDLWRGINSTTRNLIRRAERDGLTADVLAGERAADALGGFAGLAGPGFGHRPDAVAAFAAVRRTLFVESELPALAHVVLVRRGDEALSAVVTCESNGAGYYLLAFNTPAGLAANANRLALWRAILAARERGVRTFLLGSHDQGAGKAAAISGFKRQFGGTVQAAPRVAWTLRPGRERLLALVAGLASWARAWGRQAEPGVGRGSAADDRQRGANGA